jgi:hypothetical protein
MKIIKETSRKVGTIDGYTGWCNSCGTLVEYSERLIVIEIADDEEKVTLVPVDRLVCPECNKELITIYIYKNLEVTEELAKLREGSK